MKQQHNYLIRVYACAGFWILKDECEYTGTKTGAIKKARERKKFVFENISQLTLRYEVYELCDDDPNYGYLIAGPNKIKVYCD